jgi:photosystem II reaction center protein PsbP
MEEVLMRFTGFFRNLARNILLACSMLLVLLLAACGSTGASPGSTPTSAPTSQPSQAASPTSATTANLTTYTGNGFTIGYPQGWKVNAAGKSVVFADASGVYNLTIVVTPDPGGLVSPDTIVTTVIQGAKNALKNPQDVNVQSTVTIGGDRWVQKSVTGTSSAAGQNGVVQLVFASDNHPATSPSTNNFTITYSTLQAMFNAANSQYYQPMLQSFKFTS